LTVSATTHIGPENPNVSSVVLAGVNPNTALRYLNDVTTIWKATDKLTLTTDLNYIRDDGFNATGYGVAQYATYAINDWLKITGRGEVWRDNNGFFVASYPGNLDFVMFEHGNPLAVAIGGGPTTMKATDSVPRRALPSTSISIRKKNRPSRWSHRLCKAARVAIWSRRCSGR